MHRKCPRWVRYKAVSWESFKKQNKIKQNPLAYGSRTWQKMASLLSMSALMRNPDALSLFFFSFFQNIFKGFEPSCCPPNMCFSFSMGWLLSTLIFSSLWTYRLNSKLRNWYKASYFYTLRLNHWVRVGYFSHYPHLPPPASSTKERAPGRHTQLSTGLQTEEALAIWPLHLGYSGLSLGVNHIFNYFFSQDHTSTSPFSIRCLDWAF